MKLNNIKLFVIRFPAPPLTGQSLERYLTNYTEEQTAPVLALLSQADNT
jgi:hypothetical protein